MAPAASPLALSARPSSFESDDVAAATEQTAAIQTTSTRMSIFYIKWSAPRSLSLLLFWQSQTPVEHVKALIEAGKLAEARTAIATLDSSLPEVAISTS